MSCEKTGAHILIECYGLYAVTDAHKIGDAYAFRVAGVSFEPMRETVHYRVRDFAEWWDRGVEESGRNSTLIATADQVVRLN